MVRRNDKTPTPKPKLLLTEEELSRMRRLNKQRAKQMEKEVCSYLGASRTPMSGAGFVKGDGIMYLPNDAGIAVLECKVSSKLHKKMGPQLFIMAEWITKLREDTDALKGLGARFGFLVTKWHTWREKAVYIPIEHIPAIENIAQTSIIPNGILVDGTRYKSYGMLRSQYLRSIGGILRMKTGDLLITNIEQIKEWLT